MLIPYVFAAFSGGGVKGFASLVTQGLLVDGGTSFEAAGLIANACIHCIDAMHVCLMLT